jgi:hypothetical protein
MYTVEEQLKRIETPVSSGFGIKLTLCPSGWIGMHIARASCIAHRSKIASFLACQSLFLVQKSGPRSAGQKPDGHKVNFRACNRTDR